MYSLDDQGLLGTAKKHHSRIKLHVLKNNSINRYISMYAITKKLLKSFSSWKDYQK